jgi:hypothetical protein
VFDSAIRTAGDLAGVFEYDGETGYFYLYAVVSNTEGTVLGAIRVLTSPPDFLDDELAVRWENTENVVGLFIRHQPWAAFACDTGTAYDGDYRPGSQAEIPGDVVELFRRFRDRAG